jgi:hypothetical protein
MNNTSGTLDSYTPQQEAAILALQKYLREELNYNGPEIGFWFLLRFGRARNFHLANMKTMIKGYVEYRRDIEQRGIDRLDYYEAVAPVFKYFDGGFFHTDKENRPVYYFFFGNVDFGNLFANHSIEQVINAHIHLLERFVHVVLPTCSQVFNRRIETSLTIVDMKNLSLMSLAKGKVREFGERLTRIAQSHFPETLGQLFFVNAPTFFSIIWSIIKPWLNEHTRKRITILSSNGHQELAKVVDPDKLHVYFGGNCHDDYRLNPGPWDATLKQSFQDRSFYLANYKETMSKYYYSEAEKGAYAQSRLRNLMSEVHDKEEFRENCMVKKTPNLNVRVSIKDDSRRIIEGLSFLSNNTTTDR